MRKTIEAQFKEVLAKDTRILEHLSEAALRRALAIYYKDKDMTLTQIAIKLGVSKQAVYYHHKDKTNDSTNK